MKPLIPPEIPGSAELTRLGDALVEKGWSFALFGGAARDIFLNGSEAKPRDFDLVVVDCPNASDLKEALAPYRPVLNRFGGFTFKVGDIPFDVWRLEDTWALQRLNIQAPVLTDLFKYTFFNIECIVIEGPTGRTIVDPVFEAGVSERILELNYPDNPFLLLALIRTVVFADKYGMQIGTKLREWVKVHRRETHKGGLIKGIQTKYYGRVLLSQEALSQFVEEL